MSRLTLKVCACNSYKYVLVNSPFLFQCMCLAAKCSAAGQGWAGSAELVCWGVEGVSPLVLLGQSLGRWLMFLLLTS